MREKDISTALPDKVLKDELETLKARRAVIYGAQNKEQQEGIKDNLRGLSISGGGIRSSTFSLGVIQALAGKKLFKDFDYISTVSGGGYTGSLLSSILNSTDQNPASFPLRMAIGKEESNALKHLRNGSNYLTPGGLIEKTRLMAVIVRGLILNFLLFLPWIMLAVIATEFWHEYIPEMDLYQWIYALPPTLRYAVWFVVVASAYFLLTGHSSLKKSWNVRNRYEKFIGMLLIMAIVLVILKAFESAIHWAIQMQWDEFRDDLASRMSLVSLVLTGSLLVGGISVIKMLSGASPLVAKISVTIVGLLGPGILFSVYILMVIAQVDSPFISFDKRFEKFASENAITGQDTGQSIELLLTPNQVKAFTTKDVDYTTDSSETGEARVTAMFCESGHWLFSRPEQQLDVIGAEHCSHERHEADSFDHVLQLRPVRIWGANEPDQEVLDFELYGLNLHMFKAQGNTHNNSAWLSDWDFSLATILLLILNHLCVSVNKSSLHSFFRDRLSRLYLVKEVQKEIVQNDNLKLSELNNLGTYAPYHIINATLNLQGDVTESQRGRDADFFFFSKHYCGGPHTGYCETQKMEAEDKNLNLGTAMAISAAAASPNMGESTIRPLIFLFTLLNLRLGYWVANPAYLNSKKRIGHAHTGYLLKEAMGNTTANTSLVNISDGGHLENLAIYEMLRRRCKTIVCIDGEADPDHLFPGLITLIRIARIDLGIEIQIDLDKLKLDSSLLCHSHFSIGDIIYGEDAEKGKLIYVKSSITSTSLENPFLEKFRADNPAFPHESTADQFFHEKQFEAYRALGESVGRELVKQIESGAIPWPVPIHD